MYIFLIWWLVDEGHIIRTSASHASKIYTNNCLKSQEKLIFLTSGVREDGGRGWEGKGNP